MGKLMLGIIYSLLAGAIITFQGVFSSRVSDRIGLWETTAVVHAIGFAFALFMVLFLGKGNIRELAGINKLYLTGGILGVMIIYSVAAGIGLLGASFSIAITLITQLIFATLVDTLGLFDTPKMDFDISKIIGLVVMIIGVIIFKSKG